MSQAFPELAKGNKVAERNTVIVGKWAKYQVQRIKERERPNAGEISKVKTGQSGGAGRKQGGAGGEGGGRRSLHFSDRR